MLLKARSSNVHAVNTFCKLCCLCRLLAGVDMALGFKGFHQHHGDLNAKSDTECKVRVLKTIMGIEISLWARTTLDSP